MRIIEFRGRSYTDNKWHYGYYFYRFGTPFTGERHEITDGAGLGWNCPAETIGQYTGRKDKDGRWIYEGDLVEWDGNSMDTYKIMYGDDASFFGVPVNGKMEQVAGESLSLLNSELALVIVGNIHDNPTLLEGRMDEN